MIQVYPFASGSEYTASFAISSSFATNVELVDYVFTASNAGAVQFPTSGSAAEVNLCLITYNQYIQLLSGSSIEQCNFT
jgi:hypothetical protein